MPTEHTAQRKSAEDCQRVKSPIQAYLERLHAKCSKLQDGQIATYIPELSKADPNWFGICIATTDGRVYEVGDTRQPFTIQSISKPFVYGIALEDRGINTVLGKIGVEPTGDAFNSISLAPESGCPFNPMINAGAIAATSLVVGDSSDDKMQRILRVFSTYAGRELSIDTTVYKSEKETGHRNRAIGHMLRNFNILNEDPDIALDLYFQQCSISVDARDLSLMAATLANGGVNPLTKDRAISDEFLENLMTIMTTCGMYDYAGEWMYWIGIPAKSGVAGGIMAVMPGQAGIGVFSPPLDARGNSVRGIEVCKNLSRDFNLHCLRVPRSSRSAIRAQYDISKIRSKRLRGERDSEILDKSGTRAKVYELQGDLVFSTVEVTVRRIVDASDTLDIAVIDFKRVTNIEDSSAQILLELIRTLGVNGKFLLLASLQQRHSKFIRFLQEQLTNDDQERTWLRIFPDMDIAIEWCENRLIAGQRLDDGSHEVKLAEHDLCRGLTTEAVAFLETILKRRRYEPGELIVRKDDPADEIYLLMSGEVSVRIDLPNGQIKRLSTLSPGMAFGEIAVINRSVRSADVHADKHVECYLLSTAAFEELGETNPMIKMTLLQNLLRNFSRMLTMVEREVTTLAW
ncbi:MAG: glutaminase A [Thermodesulfobacteriota bacterium]